MKNIALIFCVFLSICSYGQKVSSYTPLVGSISDTDLFDMSEDIGVGLYATRSFTGLQMRTFSADGSIYTGSGSLGINTIVTQSDNSLKFTGGIVDMFSVNGLTFSVDGLNKRVGIGIAAPTSKLHVVGNSEITSDLKVDGTTFNVIAATNNVGIGTISPTNKLHVIGNSYTSGIARVGTLVNLDQAFGTDKLSVAGNIVTNSGFLLADATPTNNFNFIITQSAGVARMSFGRLVAASSAIGLNLSVPSENQALISWGLEGGVAYSHIGSSVFGNSIILDLEQYGFGIRTEQKDVVINTSSGSGISAFRVLKGNGNVGIGVSAPSAKLDIVGNAEINGILSTPTQSIILGAAVTAFAITSNDMIITGDAGGNTIATITGATSGTWLSLEFVDALVTITDNNAGTSNTINLSAPFTSADNAILSLRYNGTSWLERSRSFN